MNEEEKLTTEIKLYTQEQILKAIYFGAELGNTAGFEEGHDTWIEQQVDKFLDSLNQP